MADRSEEVRLDRKEEATLDYSTKLAIDRTRAAYERTMLAWVRTAASLITFGFSVSKFFDLEKPGKSYGGIIGPRHFGIILVCVGLASLILAVVEQRQGIRELGAVYRHRKYSMAIIVAALVAALGVVALVGMLF